MANGGLGGAEIGSLAGDVTTGAGAVVGVFVLGASARTAGVGAVGFCGVIAALGVPGIVSLHPDHPKKPAAKTQTRNKMARSRRIDVLRDR